MEIEERTIDRHCLGCRYYKVLYRIIGWCDYIFMEGHRRPCQPGKDCTVKKIDN